MKIKLLRVLILAWIVTSCSREEISIPTHGDYFPLAIGNYWIYDVDETSYTLLGESQFTYELRETVTDTLLGSDTSWLILRERRSAESDDWSADSVYTVRKTSIGVVLTQSNQSFLRLSYPVEVGKKWNGNAFNGASGENYEYVPVSSTGSSLALEGLIQVTQSNIEQNLVNQDQRFEIYANQVGLVEKNYIRLNFSTSGENLGEIESGRILKQYLKEYGQN